MAAIEVRGLSKAYGDREVLSDVTFQVETGSFFGCFGPNGAGKSTMLKILTGQISRSAGEARVLGMDPQADPLGTRRAIGIVPEAESPPSYLTAREFLEFVGNVRKVDRLDERIARWIGFFDLEEVDGVMCRDMSKGTRQKVMLSSAFLHEPPLLFLDEPFVNLDPIYQRKLREYLLEVRDEGRTVFLCSHILEVAGKLCRDMVVLSHGRAVASGNVAEIASDGDLESAFLRLVSAT